MEIVLSMLTLLYANFRDNYSDMMLIITQKILKCLLFLVGCLSIPFCRLTSFRKSKSLPLIKNEILLRSASEIARQIRRKELSSKEVVNIYIERCKDVNPMLNAIVEARFEAAIQEAENVDDFLKSTTKTEKELAREMPLLGVPMTVKESIAVQGMSHSVGVKKTNPDKAEYDASVVQMVREAGAIVLLVSNTPELCLCWETYNNVTGTTRNPYDTNRTAGGSSGGEAALLSSAASTLSLSSDIAGSARLPAMFCGVFGHKPTAGWVPCKGHKPDSSDKSWPHYFTIGTMVRYAEDLSLILKVVSESEEARHRLDQKVSLKNMRFFYMDDGSAITRSVDGDVKQAIQMLRTHLEIAHGVKVHKAEMKNMNISFNISSYLLLHMDVDWIYDRSRPLTFGRICIELLKYFCFMSPHTLPTIMYGLLTWIVKKFPKKYHLNMLEKRALLKKEFEDLLGDNGVLIYPSFVSAAYYPLETFHNVANFTYMMIYNVLGLPVTQCPMGLNSKGLPIGLQIVGNSGCDHLTIAVAQEIQAAFGGWQQPTNDRVV